MTGFCRLNSARHNMINRRSDQTYRQHGNGRFNRMGAIERDEEQSACRESHDAEA